MWWQLFRKQKKDVQSADDLLMEQQLWIAHHEWELAQIRLNDALEKDEIDYAVYMMEAAEKRYDMLIKKMKAAQQQTRNAQIKRQDEQEGNETISGL